jgi:hypothetical protein
MVRSLVRIVWSPILIVSLAALASSPPTHAQDQDRTHFDQETNPVRKAKAFQKVGQDLMVQFGKQAADGDYGAALHTLMSYRDDARTALTGLQSTGVDAERHSDGFKQLQICLRKGVWELQRSMSLIPDEQKATVRALADNLIEMQSRLEHLLFPRDSGSAPPDKPKQ